MGHLGGKVKVIWFTFQLINPPLTRSSLSTLLANEGKDKDALQLPAYAIEITYVLQHFVEIFVSHIVSEEKWNVMKYKRGRGKN